MEQRQSQVNESKAEQVTLGAEMREIKTKKSKLDSSLSDQERKKKERMDELK